MSRPGLDAVRDRLLAGARRVKGTDRVALADCAGRVLAESLGPAGELAAGTVLDAQAIGLAASAGLTVLPVLRRLQVAWLSCGIDEPRRAALARWLDALGCEIVDLGGVPETPALVRRVLRRAGAEHDLVIAVGGADGLREAVAAEGEFETLAIDDHPDGALAFGRVGNADFIGLPGDAARVEAAMASLVGPFIRKCQGAAVPTDGPPRESGADDMVHLPSIADSP